MHTKTRRKQIDNKAGTGSLDRENWVEPQRHVKSGLPSRGCSGCYGGAFDRVKTRPICAPSKGLNVPRVRFPWIQKMFIQVKQYWNEFEVAWLITRVVWSELYEKRVWYCNIFWKKVFFFSEWLINYLLLFFEFCY